MRNDHAWREIKTMTLIGASVHTDHVLIASDSLAINPGMGVTDDHCVKLWTLQNQSLVWGYYGLAPIGDGFHRWLDGIEDDFTDWITFESLIADGMATLNGAMQRRADLRGQPIQSDETIIAQIAGYVGGKPGILTAWQSGHTQLSSDFAFIGSPSGFAAALAVKRTLEQERKKFALDASTLNNIMEIASRLIAGCGPPIQMWKVTQDGAEQL